MFESSDAEIQSDDAISVSYFVDEAGTPTLFERRGRKQIIGTDGCSRYFILGKLDVEDPERLAREMQALRTELLGDAYLSKIPSMQPERERTAVRFHANDDAPEVRYRVFSLLMNLDVKFSAVLRDKRCVLDEVKARNAAEPDYRYRENEFYDMLVGHLFKSGFHEADSFSIRFARRHTNARTAALRTAIERARDVYQQNFGVKATAKVEIHDILSKDSEGLQAVDYFLWALQRLFERGEDRYWEFVRTRARVVYDLDDQRKDKFGRFYTPTAPLTADCLAGRAKK